MSAELLALLDGLDAAREKATPGEWESDGALVLPGYWGDTPPVLARTNDDLDAALIVAAVNSLPKLTAALRAALRKAEDLRTYTATRDGAYAYDRAATHIEDAIAAALTPEQADR